MKNLFSEVWLAPVQLNLSYLFQHGCIGRPVKQRDARRKSSRLLGDGQTILLNTFWWSRIWRRKSHFYEWNRLVMRSSNFKNNFWQRISWFSHRWRTQRIAISNVNCRSESSNLWTHLALPADLIWGACLFEGRELFRTTAFFFWKRLTDRYWGFLPFTVAPLK